MRVPRPAGARAAISGGGLDLSSNDRFVDLAENDFDLAIRTGDLKDKAGVIARRVTRLHMVVCASPTYLDTPRRPHCPTS
ncbi:LysR substrate-binding domain-containing protein [Paraburkholderia strydomiana]|uniref:LysR substrate-binding domain-containing protein n=1 Tax=Paraburkholderia strydomiana TaxID=1245417 RepID=UPI0038BBA2A4